MPPRLRAASPAPSCNPPYPPCVRSRPASCNWSVVQSRRAPCTCRAGLAVRFALFFEHHVPRPWEVDDEQRVFGEALEQIELADRLGFHCAWLVEHHCLEEYSHSSAPELFL